MLVNKREFNYFADCLSMQIKWLNLRNETFPPVLGRRGKDWSWYASVPSSCCRPSTTDVSFWFPTVQVPRNMQVNIKDFFKFSTLNFGTKYVFSFHTSRVLVLTSTFKVMEMVTWDNTFKRVHKLPITSFWRIIGAIKSRACWLEKKVNVSDCVGAGGKTIWRSKSLVETCHSPRNVTQIFKEVFANFQSVR